MFSDAFNKFWDFINTPLIPGTVEFDLAITFFLALAVINGVLFFKYK